MICYNDLIEQLQYQTVLCVGDIILDEFLYGDANRISPESPTPVLLIKRSEMMIGGAGNVAKNLSALGVKCIFISILSEDINGLKLREMLNNEPFIESHFVLVNDRPTTHKVRFVSDKYSSHLLRADWEETAPICDNLEDKIIEIITSKIPLVGAVIISDYAKGLLTPRVIKEIIINSHYNKKPVIVNPKGCDYSIYQHADILTPNQHELGQATMRLINSEQELINAANTIIQKFNNKAIIVTRSEKGMTLVSSNHQYKHIPAHPVRVRDVSGAGDTVVATLGAFLAMKADYETAVYLSNVAASVVVSKNGTATLSPEELRNVLFTKSFFIASKIINDFNIIKPFIDNLKKQNIKIGFTNGCFDLLHPGHIQLLNTAREACDFLIVGLNSDASVSRLKGKERPVQNQNARAKVLSGLTAVDMIIIFEEDTPFKLIKLISPSVLIKGSDYTKEQVVGGDFVQKNGGEVILVDFILNQSTTRLVDKLKHLSTIDLTSS